MEGASLLNHFRQQKENEYFYLTISVYIKDLLVRTISLIENLSTDIFETRKLSVLMSVPWRLLQIFRFQGLIQMLKQGLSN